MAAQVATLASELGLTRQVLVLNRTQAPCDLPAIPGLPPLAAAIPPLSSLAERQLRSPSVLGLPQRDTIDGACRAILSALEALPRRQAEGAAPSPPPR